MREITRREALAGAASLGAVGVAGCVSDSSENGPENSSEDDPGDESQGTENGEPDESFDVELVDSSITTTDASCGSGEGGSASAVTEEGALVVEGVVPTSDPCYEASLSESATALEGRVLSVGVEASEVESAENCVTCLGEVTYEARFEFSSDIEDVSTFESITVDHRGMDGETHVVTGERVESESGGEGGDGEGEPSDAGRADTEPGAAVMGHSIETVEADCGSATDDRVVSSGVARDNTVTVEGVVTAPNPCHEATVEGVEFRDGLLNVEVGATPLEEEGMCVQCLGAISYKATVQVAESVSVEDVSVSSRASVSND